MKLTSDLKEGILFVYLTGDLLGETNGMELIDILNEKVTIHVHNCVIDLSSVRYMSSTGIGVLITALTKIKNKGGELVLLNPTEQILKLLTITKLNLIFQVYASEEEVLNTFKK